MKPAAHEIFEMTKKRGFWLRCFLRRAKRWSVIVFLSLLATTVLGWSQLLPFPCSGTASECKEKHDEFCKTLEGNEPNLSVPRQTRVWGVLLDPTGAVFSHPAPGLTLELHAGKDFRLLHSSEISDMGTFVFGTVPQGAYRVIVVIMKDGKATRFHGWNQLRGLTCGDTDKCTLAVLLEVHGTDNPVDFCPLR